MSLKVKIVLLVVIPIVVLLIVRIRFANLKPLMKAANKLQNNDLNFEFQEQKGRDEISQLFEAFREATIRLKGNMKNLHQNTGEVSDEMDNITEAVESVAQGMNEATIASTPLQFKNKRRLWMK